MNNLTIPFRTCSIGNCLDRHRANGFCNKHNIRFRKFGDANQTQHPTRGVGATAEIRFWSRVALTANINRCWEWLGSCQRQGYGIQKYKGKVILAHRLAFFYTYGYWPDLLVLHKCDNPPCVNPNHLFGGTHKDNSDDMISKGRAVHPVGDCLPRAELRTSQVLAIRADTRTARKIATDHKISNSTVYTIKAGKSWRHLL